VPVDPKQQQLPPEPRSFYTDEELDRRLEQVENCLAGWEHGLPAMRREIAALRREIFPTIPRAA
jgi:hypothetical protein